MGTADRALTEMAHTESNPSIPIYLGLIGLINQHPFDTDVLAQVAAMAKEEESLPRSHTGPYSGIQPAELHEFAVRIHDAQTLDERYRLLAGQTSNGTLWYDAILGRSNLKTAEFLSEHLGFGRRERALDVGCGPGGLTELLDRSASRVIGLDRSELLLGIAKKRTGENRTLLTGGNAVNLPFAGQSFDLIVSNGLTHYLPPDALLSFYEEIARVITRNGSYFEIFVVGNPDAPVHLTEAHFLTNAKGVLACQIDRMITTVPDDTANHQPVDLVMKEVLRGAGLTDISFTDYARGMCLFQFKRNASMDDLIHMSI